MILVTGATGFVGAALVRRLARERRVRALVRPGSDSGRIAGEAELFEGRIEPNANWSEALRDVSEVVHCAARVHVMNDTAKDPLAEFRRVNVDGTQSLARQAALAGARRFLYVSSIKVNGESTRPGFPFTADQPARPEDPYGISKMEAEEVLRSIALDTGMEVTIVRPPLVYGPGVKANFLALMKGLNTGIPLPLGGLTQNRRSLVALDNLVDLLVKCIEHPAAANQTFLVADRESVSTTELLRRVGQALGRRARLFPVPAPVLDFGAALLGKADMAKRLCESLELDIGKTQQMLCWEPPITLDDGLRRTTEYWLASRAKVAATAMGRP